MNKSFKINNNGKKNEAKLGSSLRGLRSLLKQSAL
jgi:hypothetical protein